MAWSTSWHLQRIPKNDSGKKSLRKNTEELSAVLIAYYKGDRVLDELDDERDLVTDWRPCLGWALAALNRATACWAILFHMLSSLSA